MRYCDVLGIDADGADDMLPPELLGLEVRLFSLSKKEEAPCALCPVPCALCPVPSALCPLPYAPSSTPTLTRTPHGTARGCQDRCQDHLLQGRLLLLQHW